MKKLNISCAVVGLSAVLLLSGCGKDGDGKLEMKEPKKELSEMPPGVKWTVNGPVDEAGNSIQIPEGK